MNSNILIIDDDPKILDLFQNILCPGKTSLGELKKMLGAADSKARKEEERFQLAAAKQGVEGVELVMNAMKSNNPFAVAFVDMRMPPGIDGLETARRLREIDDRLYIVVLTAYTDRSPDEIQEAVKHDVLLVRKPIAGDEIFQLARNLCNSWSRDEVLRHVREMLESALLIHS